MKNGYLFVGAAVLSSLPGAGRASSIKNPETADERPNIIVILLDDMGYSDIGCFGSEIPTPNIDRLAEHGIRYTNLYNTGRSCPSRASLITGLYPHQTGIGGMSEDGEDINRQRSKMDQGIYGYRGALNRNCVTIAEVLKTAGYHTYMTGKWHLGLIGQEKWPLQRGFDRFYGILSGATSYFRPSGNRGLTLDNEQLPAPGKGYYTTDAFTDKAIEFLGSRQDDKPFFLYLAYNAPHWPLHAKQSDMDKFIGKYDAGWEAVRQARYEKMVRLGIIDPDWGLAEWENRSWQELTDRERKESAYRMAVYAAQISCVDHNVGKLIDYLEKRGELDHTFILFLADNGACAENYSESGGGTIAQINDPAKSGVVSYGKPWAQVSNTPFRKYKVRAYEGGISTPFILSWPGKLNRYNGDIRRNICFLLDIMATLTEVSGAVYPATFHSGEKIHPLVGKSLIPTIHDPAAELHEYIYGEHESNCFVRWKQWKAVKDIQSLHWELYDIEADRSETNDLSTKYPQLLYDLQEKWLDWAEHTYVKPRTIQEVFFPLELAVKDRARRDAQKALKTVQKKKNADAGQVARAESDLRQARLEFERMRKQLEQKQGWRTLKNGAVVMFPARNTDANRPNRH